MSDRGHIKADKYLPPGEVVAVRRRYARGRCRKCEGPTDRPTHKLCRDCYTGVPEKTPLRLWLLKHGRSLESLAAQTRLHSRTLLRICAGAPANGESALRLHEVTGIEVAVLLRGAGG